jgi:ribosomal subunit interface protein
MAAQLQITVREMPPSNALETTIRRKVADLERVYPRITSVRATVEAPHHHHNQGNHYTVRLDITVPGIEILVNRDHSEDVYVAVRDAFQAARRQLVEYAERGQRADKVHRPTRRAVAPGKTPDE